jgi:hypothetical protein
VTLYTVIALALVGILAILARGSAVNLLLEVST